MRPLFLICLLPCLCQCGAGPSTPDEKLAEPGKASVEGKSTSAVAEGINFYLHDDTRGTGGERVGPTLWVHADRGDLDVATGKSVLQGVRAVVYRDEAENVTFEAPAGKVDENRKVASMSGGVSAVAGTLRIESDEIEYDHSSEIAETQGNARMVNGDTLLDAEGLSLHTGVNTFELVGVRGQFEFGSEINQITSGRAKNVTPIVFAAAVYGATEDTSDKKVGGFDYDYIEIHHVGYLEGNYATGRLEEMADGVSVTFVADDQTKNLIIRAQTVTFEYASDDASKPTKIKIEGGVTVESRKVTMQSEHAEINFDTGEALFTGKPEIEGPWLKGKMEIKSVLFNLNNNKIFLDSPHGGAVKLPRSSEKPKENSEPAAAGEKED